MRIAFIVPGPPVPCARARVVSRPGRKTRAVTPSKTRAYKVHVAWYARVAVATLRQPATGSPPPSIWPLDATSYGVRLMVYREADRGDADNFYKGVVDACHGILWSNDMRITHALVEMFIDRKNPRVEVEAWTR